MPLMQATRAHRYYVYSPDIGRRLLMTPGLGDPSIQRADELAVGLAQSMGAWSVVRENGPISKPKITLLWKKEHPESVEEMLYKELTVRFGASATTAEIAAAATALAIKIKERTT